MSYARYLLRRTGFAALSAYVVVSLTFALVALTPNTALQGRLGAAEYFDRAGPEELAEIRATFLEARNLDRPVLERYVDWLVDISTLDWGYSFAYREPVWSVLEASVPATARYVVPGLLLAVAFGVVLGLVAALARNSATDWTVRVASYALFGIPAFIFAVLVAHVTGGQWMEGGGRGVAQRWVETSLDPFVIATAAVAVSGLAAQVRFARVSALDVVDEPFVKLLEAKGAGRLRVARHVLRNAALPIVTVSTTELLAVLVLNIYVVEDVLAIDGLASASLTAVWQRDMPLIIGTTMVLVFVGILGNLLQDVLYGYLDPEIERG